MRCLRCGVCCILLVCICSSRIRHTRCALVTGVQTCALPVILVGIPRMGPENRNEAARFVTLIDALYEHNVKLLAAADAESAQLYTEGDGAFEFERTVSRLEEMRSEEYLAQGHGVG